MMRSFVVILCLIGFFSGTAALAQSSVGEAASVELPDPLTKEAVNELVARLSDQEVRNLLLERLDAVAEAGVTGPTEHMSALEFFTFALEAGVNSVVVAIQRLPILWSSQIESFSNFWTGLGGDGVAKLLGAIALALAIGYAAELLVDRMTRKLHEVAPSEAEAQTLREQLSFLFKRLCRELFGLFAFFVVTRMVGRALVPDAGVAFASVFFFNMVVIPRLGIALSKFLLAPNDPKFRLVHTDDWTAKYLHRNVIGLLLLAGFSILIVQFNQMNGVPVGESRLGFWLNMAVHIYVGVMAWRARAGLTMMMRGADTDVTPWEERVARGYPYFAIAISAAMWFVVNVLAGMEQFELLLNSPHYTTMFLLLMAPSLDTAVRGLVRHLTPPMTGEGMLAERAYWASQRAWVRIGRVITFALVVTLIARAWRINLMNMAGGDVGSQFATSAFGFLIIIATGYLIFELVTLWFNSKLAAERTAAGIDLSDEELAGGEGGAGGGSRMSTVLPLIKGVLQVTIVTIFLLLGLGNLGIDTTPLLAGAGILGLAIGFGAQKLVSDVVGGVFFLVDDAFRAGEYVEVSGTRGTVEHISVRSLQLRHHRGPVHTIPYGEIAQLTNYSRDWVIMKLKFTVPFGTDPNKVKKIFKEIGKEMIAMEEFKEDMMQPFKSQGVFDFDDRGMVIRGKFMAKPGKQFTIRKEIYNRVKARFEEAGIPFARREVHVAVTGFDDSDNKTEDDMRDKIAGAAGAAAQQLEPKPG